MTILLLALQWSSFFIMVMLMVGTLKHKDVLAHIIKLKFRVMLVTLRIEIYQVAFLLRHSTEVRGLCLMKYSNKRLHDLPYFYNCTFTIPCMYLDCCCFFHFVLVHFVLDPGTILVYVDQSHLELFRWNILASMNLYFLKNVASLLSVSKLGLLVTLLG